MSEYYISDKDLTLVRVLDTYKSAIWARRYWENGDFEIVVPATTEMLDCLRSGYYVEKSGSDMICLISAIRLTSDPEKGNLLTVTGQSAQELLDRRVIWNTVQCNGTAEPFILDTVSAQLGRDAAAGRRWTNTSGTRIFGVGTASGLPDGLTERVSYKNLGEKVREWCRRFGWGYKVERMNNLLTFRLYAGTDRRNSVVFSPRYENISTETRTNNAVTYRSTALIAGAGEGDERERCVTGEATGCDRSEIFVDARDLAKTMTFADLQLIYPGGYIYSGPDYTYIWSNFRINVTGDADVAEYSAKFPSGSIVTESGVKYFQIPSLTGAILPSDSPADNDEVTLTDNLYWILLRSRGRDKLAECPWTTTFDAEIQPDVTFVLGVDYDLGDIVTVETVDGAELAARITEIIESEDERGTKVLPKFEYMEA